MYYCSVSEIPSNFNPFRSGTYGANGHPKEVETGLTGKEPTLMSGTINALCTCVCCVVCVCMRVCVCECTCVSAYACVCVLVYVCVCRCVCSMHELSLTVGKTVFSQQSNPRLFPFPHALVYVWF